MRLKDKMWHSNGKELKYHQFLLCSWLSQYRVVYKVQIPQSYFYDSELNLVRSCVTMRIGEQTKDESFKFKSCINNGDIVCFVAPTHVTSVTPLY